MRFAIVIPFYGAWSPWFHYYLSTCQYLGSGVEVVVVTDNEAPREAAAIANVRFVHLAFEELRERLASLTGYRPAIRRDNVHKLCDCRPLYGKLFEAELRGYDFWAYGDEDVFYGNLLKFIHRRYFSDYDVISAARQAKAFGPLTFVRNTERLRDLFLRECRTLQVAIEDERWQGHDEGFRQDQDTFGTILARTPDVRSVALALTSDDLYYAGDFNTSSDYELCEHRDPARVRTNWGLFWEKGRLLDSGREIPFFHFLKSKDRLLNPGFRESFEGRHALVDSFCCSHKGLIERAEYDSVVPAAPMPEARQPERPRFALNRPGTTDFIDYRDYGAFHGNDSLYYRYELKAPEALAEALGEGLLFGSAWVRENPHYQHLERQGLLRGGHWAHVGTAYPERDFFSWAEAPEAPGLKLFYTADALLRAGQLPHALKAYQAITVFYPNHYAWDPRTQCSWYLGPAALAAIERICAQYPALGVRFTGAKVQLHNAAPHLNDPKQTTHEHDIVIVSPGQFRRADGGKPTRAHPRLQAAQRTASTGRPTSARSR